MPITGEKEYDVYVLIEHRSFWAWIFWWLTPTYEIVLGQDFASAEDAKNQAQFRTNASGGRAIGIAADALVCCRETQLLVD
jgi:hypothetical protein